MASGIDNSIPRSFRVVSSSDAASKDDCEIQLSTSLTLPRLVEAEIALLSCVLPRAHHTFTIVCGSFVSEFMLTFKHLDQRFRFIACYDDQSGVLTWCYENVDSMTKQQERVRIHFNVPFVV